MEPSGSATDAADGSSLRPRLFYFNGGFFTQKRVRRMLELAGYDLKLGKPGPDDLVAVWGKSPTSGRGAVVSEAVGAGLCHVEDAFLRSIRPGRDGEPPLGLTLDRQRPYFDSAGPSDLETHLATAAFDDAHLLQRARDAMARIKDANLSKYNDFDPDAPIPKPGYVLVIDQTRGDASIKHGGASADHFREMLAFAQEEHPTARILIKAHPETAGGHRKGHFGLGDVTERISLYEHQAPVYDLLDGAIAVYTVSSGLGFEALLAGHKPIVFGQPFYAGWGLTDDRQPIDRRQRKLTRAQLFAGVMLDYCRWYDPYRDRLCALEDLLDTLEALVRAHAQDRDGHTALGMRLWKRGPIQAIFGGARAGPKARVRFSRDEDAALAHSRGGSLLVWASKEPEGLAARANAQGTRLLRVEDGFLRSRGLGADLVAPLSLVTDDRGIYYDPTRPSELESMIAAADALGPQQLARAARLRRQIVTLGVSKYNLDGTVPDFDAGDREVILVPGQVADDASIRLGTSEVRDNAALLAAVRRDFPDAFVVYKPHPDVEARLRDGKITAADADLVAAHMDAMALLGKVDRVCTMTSLLGFEALLRNVPVICYGAPFFAGWGLTEDRGRVPARRGEVSLDGLVHAALIAYPRYFDPVTRLPCPPEVAVERLATGTLPRAGLANRLLSKLQGALAGYAFLWRG